MFSFTPHIGEQCNKGRFCEESNYLHAVTPVNAHIADFLTGDSAGTSCRLQF